MWLPHKADSSLNACLLAVRTACNVRGQLQADLHSFAVPQQGLGGVLKDSIPVLSPLVAQRPVGEGHAPARLAGQGLGVLLQHGS